MQSAKEGASAGNLTCRIAKTREDRKAVFELRYKVYVEEMTKRLPSANDVDKTVEDEIEQHATIFLVETPRGEVIATLRGVWGGTVVPNVYKSWFGLDRIAEVPEKSMNFSSRLMIKAEWRRGQALR